MSRLIEAARQNLQNAGLSQEQARLRSEEVSTIHQIYVGMFTNAMTLLRGVKDPPLFWRNVPGLKQVESFMAKHLDTTRFMTETWEDEGKQPVAVTLLGRPLHRNNPYAYLRIEGLTQELQMRRDPNGDIRGFILDRSSNQYEYRDEKATKLEEVQQWRQALDFLHDRDLENRSFSD